MHRSFNLSGIEQDATLNERALAVVQRVTSYSPSSSNIELSLDKTRDGFRGELRVVSFGLKFVAEAKAENAHDVLVSLEKNVRSQVDQWKLNRVFPEVSIAFV
ncbi:MAG: hypothetical protein KDD25_03785 [Bdellovibrionales bacterium]|nr:hypothetical protein [Bdellovibrionales bacterium]